MLYIELQYFPTIVCYSVLSNQQNVDYSLYELYRKASFRNRCMIAGANGMIPLSIPISGGRGLKSAYREVGIDQGIPWQRRHFQSIRSSYGKSPYFEHYGEGLSRLFERRFDWLVDWNLACLAWVDGVFGVDSNRGFAVDDSEPELDLRDRILPSNFQSPASGPFPVYPQAFEERMGFQVNLSILDLVMSMGRMGRDLLTRTGNEFIKATH
jgi:hypothetical protein